MKSGIPDQQVEFATLMSMCFSNPSLMGLAHQWSEETTPGEVPGSHRMRSFHIAFDRGQTIMWFKKQEDLDAAFSMVKQLFLEIAQRFEGKPDIQKGITSPDLQWGD